MALAFYGRLFDFELRGKSKTSAFIDLGDQFLALQKGRTQAADDDRHFGLVVDDKDAVRRALAEAGVDALPGQFLDFLDPWGNRVEIVSYENIQSPTETGEALNEHDNHRDSCSRYGYHALSFGGSNRFRKPGSRGRTKPSPRP